MIELNQLLLCKLESPEGQDSSPVPASDAILCGEVLPDYSFENLQRIIVEQGLSEAKRLIGQEFLGFNVAVELRGSGSVGVAPDWGVLAEICGFTKRVIAAATIGSPEKAFDNSGTPSGLTVASGGAFTGTRPARYHVKVSTPGASGVAKVDITCLDDATQNAADVTVTTATPIDLGDEGATITFTFASGSLAEDDAWFVYCYTPCVAYASRAPSDAAQSGTVYHYLGEHLFKAVGVRGDVSLAFPAGAIATAQFNLQGLLSDIIDDTTPAGDFFADREIPAVVQSAGVLLGLYDGAVIPELGFTSGNRLVKRSDVNSPRGIKSFRHAKRDPGWSATVEATLEATHPFWGDLRARKEWPLNASVGSVAGNIVQVFVRRASSAENRMQNTDNVLMYGLSGQAHQTPGKYDNIEIIVR